MNKTRIIFVSLFAIASIVFAFQRVSGLMRDEPWTKQQLLEPSDLAEVLNNPNSPQPVVYSIGPQAIIKNSIDIGPAQEKEYLEKFKQQLTRLPKNTDIVIYCGCCPFNKCPNIRPAFKLLSETGYISCKLLDLPHNIKIDWIDHGYPSNN